MFKKIREKMDAAAIAAQTKAEELVKAISSERGDTNFISILIILGIVVVLAGVFIGFKDQIVEKVTQMIDAGIGTIH